FHVLGRKNCGVQVEGLARGIVIIGIVHAARDRRVVVAQNREGHGFTDEIAHLVGARPIAYRVAKADEFVDFFRLVSAHDRAQRFEVRVGIREYSDSHCAAIPDSIISFGYSSTLLRTLPSVTMRTRPVSSRTSTTSESERTSAASSSSTTSESATSR